MISYIDLYIYLYIYIYRYPSLLYLYLYLYLYLDLYIYIHPYLYYPNANPLPLLIYRYLESIYINLSFYLSLLSIYIFLFINYSQCIYIGTDLDWPTTWAFSRKGCALPRPRRPWPGTSLARASISQTWSARAPSTVQYRETRNLMGNDSLQIYLWIRKIYYHRWNHRYILYRYYIS